MGKNATFQSMYSQFVSELTRKTIKNSQLETETEIDLDLVINEDFDEDKFWGQKQLGKEVYKEIVLNYQLALKEIGEFGNLDHLANNHSVSKAYQSFNSDPIKLLKFDGKYLMDGNGRHRLEAAKLLKRQGYNIKIKAIVTKWEYLNKEINTTNNKKVSSMSHLIEGQIELLEKARHVFLQHSQEMTNLQEQLNNQIRGLEQDELNHDYLDFVEEFQLIYNAKLRDLCQQIHDEIVPQIIRKIQHLEDRV